MPALKSCPPLEALSDFLLGKLHETARESVAGHVEGCDTCLSRLEQVDQTPDSLVHNLRQPAVDDEFMQEAGCRLAVKRSQQLNPDHAENTDILRDYELVEKLGEGGMGAVYRALHKKLDKWVALKLLPTERLHSPEAVSRFEREMRAIGRLHHPNIVQALDAGEADGQHYLVMELVKGMDLSTLVRRLGKLPIADACEIVRKVALGLQHAHESDLVHRDIKPSNVMLTASGDVKILDLGLARLEEPLDGKHEVTSTGQIMGTLDYMAPEQLGDSHTVDHRADIYSLGATLYKLLTGQAPYADKRYNTPQKKLMAIATKPVESAVDVRSDIPPRLVDVLNRMLAKNPDDRFSSSDEIATTLAQFSADADLSSLFTQASQAPHLESDTKRVRKSTFDPVASSLTDTDRIENVPQLHAASSPKSTWRRSPRTVGIALALLFLAAAATVFYVSIGKATLVVVVDDEDVAAEMQEEGLVVRDRKTGRVYTISIAGEKKLPPGNYVFEPGGQLIVADDAGMKVKTDVFTLTRGGREIVRITLKEAVHELNGKWRALFDGTSLKGWAENGPKGLWRVENGVLSGGGGKNKLVYVTQAFEDFDFRAECLITHNGNSGVFTRTTANNDHRTGYEVQIGRYEQYGTGSLYGLAPNNKQIVAEDEWFTLDIRARRGQIVVRVNGQETANYTDADNRFPKGHIALQAHPQGGHVQFRKVEIRPIDNSDVPPLALAPFGAAIAKQHQQAWAEYLDLPLVWKNSLGIELLLIPPGEFLMGSSDEEQARFLKQARAVDDQEAIEWIPHEGPQHPVKITQPFYLGKYEVTQAQWETVMGKNPSKFKNSAGPVEQVSWRDAQLFLKKLNHNYSTKGMKFVLPTEAQWEYAARAGTTTAYFFGDDEAMLGEFGWIDQNRRTTQPVGQLKPNAWGLHDIYGNVLEWCEDGFDAAYYSWLPSTNPRGCYWSSERISRGGPWRGTQVKCRSAFRRGAHETHQKPYLGFRIAAIRVVSQPGDISRNEPAGWGRDDLNHTDRQAAEWALRIGGQVDVNAGSQEQKIKTVDSLPHSSFHVVGMRLEDSQVTEEDLVHVRGLRQLKSLTLRYSQVTDEGLRHLADLKQLELLHIDSCTQLTDAGLEHLRDCTALKDLGLSIRNISDAGIAHLARMTQLSVLNLNGTQVTDAGLTHLKPLVRLTELRLRGTKVTDAGLEHLRHLPQLWRLTLDGNQVASDVGAEHLKSLKRLTYLQLQNDQVTDAVLARLDLTDQIVHLGLWNTKVTDGGLAHLEGAASLRRLDLDINSLVTDSGIDHLEKLTGLRWLNFNRSQFTDAGVSRLKKALPNTEIYTH